MLGPWQVSQPEVIPLWLNCAPANVVMPPLAPFLGIRVDGILFKWQVSHGVEFDTGTWGGVRLPLDFGVTPSKVPAVTLIPWQPLHPLVIPVWLKAEFANVAPSTTGRVKLELLPT